MRRAGAAAAADTPHRLQPARASSADGMRIDAAEVAERKRYLELGDADSRALRALHQRLPAAARGFSAGFYAMLREHPKLGRLVHDPATMQRLQAAHARHFDELTAGDYDAAYVARRLEVGVTHARIGLAPEWYIGTFRRYLSGMLGTVWDDADGAAIVRAIIALARSLRLTPLAEGVETPAQRDFLLSLGCDAMQGYLFARPMPAAEFERDVLAGSAS